MAAYRLTLHPYGPDAWLLRFADKPGEAAFQAAQAISRALEAAPPSHLLEYVPGYTSLLLEFSPGSTPDLKPYLKFLQGRLGQAFEPGPVRDIPVVYDGPDLARGADHAGLTVPEVLEVHAGSVANGGSHTGIYSIASPGGWNLIGRTEVKLFDPGRVRPGQEAAMCWLQPGDRVRFIPSG